MILRSRARAFISLSIILVFSLSSYALADKKDEKAVRGTPVLWREPVNIASRNLYWGPGGEAMKPDLRRITFIKEEKGGYSTKYRVRDGSGREWVAKVGKEAQSEIAATRLMWAVGYQTEISYLVPRVYIPNKGEFTNVRFEARPKQIKRLDEWEWDDNPFVGSREFQGLKVMMVLLNNWDIKDENNKVLAVRNESTGANELRFIISDLGATFGKTGSFITRSRNKPEDFVEAKFIDELKGNYVDFHYSGKRKGVFRDITISQARWMGRWLSRLSDQQIRDAFRAANYSPEDVVMLAEGVRARITELITLPQ
ncbi:MAG TPA: hypothetical protein VNI02_11625 [Blastocatellia bacterium]|jgi:hypothetical protein|nr:hypothetical protein [Blastocatellia bacterium]